jgi:hypothetical protein
MVAHSSQDAEKDKPEMIDREFILFLKDIMM